MKEIFSCPVCNGALSRLDRTYKCQSGHSFDISKEGYVNLLLSNKNSDTSGDDKEMVRARTAFLDRGYYSPLRERMYKLIKELCPDSPVILDAGCGEGYYTSLYSTLSDSTFGIDISKSAVKHAAKRCKNASFAISSVYHMPVTDESCDIIINCFSPNAPDEFSRVLKNGGYLLYVVPAPRHLWELKSVLYDTPYENEEKEEMYDGFELLKIEKVTTCFTLDTNEKILSLFHMTPYTWNTPKESAERLSGLDRLCVTADFRIHVFKKVKKRFLQTEPSLLLSGEFLPTFASGQK